VVPITLACVLVEPYSSRPVACDAAWRLGWVRPMDTILVKIFATALALSEVMTEPRAVKTHFDPVAEPTQ